MMKIPAKQDPSAKSPQKDSNAASLVRFQLFVFLTLGRCGLGEIPFCFKTYVGKISQNRGKASRGKGEECEEEPRCYLK